ncbi:MAG: hypothetical protein QM527_09950, partial [Alphaproteobacteria bacterium]|nr:hypothetical protein [Alphaproteobacteria bacterium]
DRGLNLNQLASTKPGAIQALRERIERDMSHQQGLLAQLRTRLIKAEAERMKMQSLIDQQEQTDRQLQQMVEQKRLDEMGVSRFNARHSH